MSDYDFRTLNDKEFEVFCADLLGAAEGVRFERFKPGRDGGVDGRYFSPGEGEVVLQCKHWANTPTDQLVRALKSSELPKLDRLKPARYILAVSNPLSRADKATIKKALAPHIRIDSDILGKEDLNDLLTPRQEIERRHYKLWLHSASVLSHILNKPIFERSAFSLQQTIESIRRYVTTENHTKALTMLEKLRVVLITGEPGIGKTTLAEHLCLHYVARDFQFLKLTEDFHETEAAFESDQKQVFYFDDFLGRNYLEAVNGHEGSRIVQFMRRVNAGRDKRLILTSRSTILNQGKVLNDSFRHAKIERNEFELSVASLSEMDKAHILYNHIWHSSLREEFVESLYQDKRYRVIINHKNYNPRLISFITDADRAEGVTGEDYWAYVTRTLVNPAEVWENPFVAQQDDFGRAIVLLVVLNGKPILEGELSEAFARLVARPESAGLKGHRDFLTNLRYLTGSLLNRIVYNHGADVRAMLGLFNPSLGDYVLRRYVGDIPTLKLGFLNLRTDSSVGTIKNLVANKIVPVSVAKEIVKAVLNEAHTSKFAGYEADYIAGVVQVLIEDEVVNGKVLGLVQAALEFIASQPLSVYQESTTKVVGWAVENEYLGKEVGHRVIEQACEAGNSSEEEIKALSDLRDLVDRDTKMPEAVSKRFDGLVVEYLSDTIGDDVYADGILEDVDYGNYVGARSKVEELVVSRLEYFGVPIEGNVVREIAECFDHEQALNKLFENSADDSHDEGGEFVAPADAIDDLFDRS